MFGKREYLSGRIEFAPQGADFGRGERVRVYPDNDLRIVSAKTGEEYSIEYDSIDFAWAKYRKHEKTVKTRSFITPTPGNIWRIFSYTLLAAIIGLWAVGIAEFGVVGLLLALRSNEKPKTSTWLTRDLHVLYTRQDGKGDSFSVLFSNFARIGLFLEEFREHRPIIANTMRTAD